MPQIGLTVRTSAGSSVPAPLAAATTAATAASSGSSSNVVLVSHRGRSVSESKPAGAGTPVPVPASGAAAPRMTTAAAPPPEAGDGIRFLTVFHDLESCAMKPTIDALDTVSAVLAAVTRAATAAAAAMPPPGDLQRDWRLYKSYGGGSHLAPEQLEEFADLGLSFLAVGRKADAAGAKVRDDVMHFLESHGQPRQHAVVLLVRDAARVSAELRALQRAGMRTFLFTAGAVAGADVDPAALSPASSASNSPCPSPGGSTGSRHSDSATDGDDDFEQVDTLMGGSSGGGGCGGGAHHHYIHAGCWGSVLAEAAAASVARQRQQQQGGDVPADLAAAAGPRATRPASFAQQLLQKSAGVLAAAAAKIAEASAPAAGAANKSLKVMPMTPRLTRTVPEAVGAVVPAADDDDNDSVDDAAEAADGEDNDGGGGNDGGDDDDDDDDQGSKTPPAARNLLRAAASSPPAVRRSDSGSSFGSAGSAGSRGGSSSGSDAAQGGNPFRIVFGRMRLLTPAEAAAAAGNGNGSSDDNDDSAAGGHSGSEGKFSDDEPGRSNARFRQQHAQQQAQQQQPWRKPQSQQRRCVVAAAPPARPLGVKITECSTPHAEHLLLARDLDFNYAWLERLAAGAEAAFLVCCRLHQSGRVTDIRLCGAVERVVRNSYGFLAHPLFPTNLYFRTSDVDSTGSGGSGGRAAAGGGAGRWQRGSAYGSPRQAPARHFKGPHDDCGLRVGDCVAFRVGQKDDRVWALRLWKVPSSVARFIADSAEVTAADASPPTLHGGSSSSRSGSSTPRGHGRWAGVGTSGGYSGLRMAQPTQGQQGQQQGATANTTMNSPRGGVLAGISNSPRAASFRRSAGARRFGAATSAPMPHHGAAGAGAAASEPAGGADVSCRVAASRRLEGGLRPSFHTATTPPSRRARSPRFGSPRGPGCYQARRTWNLRDTATSVANSVLDPHQC